MYHYKETLLQIDSLNQPTSVNKGLRYLHLWYKMEIKRILIYRYSINGSQ
jgi:hypothetical protein